MSDAILLVGGAILILFVLPFVCAYFATISFSKKVYPRLQSASLNVLFSIGAFIVIFYLIEKLFSIALGLIPLAGLFSYIIGAGLYTVTGGHQEIFFLACYVGGPLLVVLRMQKWSVAPSATPNFQTPIPTPSRNSALVILTLLLVLGAAVVLWMDFKGPGGKLLAQVGAPALHHPEWCHFASYNATDSDTAVATCVQASVPPGKTIQDYCDLLPYAPGRPDHLDLTDCKTQKQVATNNPAACEALKTGGPYYADYNKCISQFVGSPEQSAYCADVEQKRDFYNLIGASCITDTNANITDTKGETALYYTRSIEEQNILFAHHADVNVKDTTGQTPLIAFISQANAGFGISSSDQDYKTIENLLKQGAKTNVSDSQGDIPLVLALKKWSALDLIKLLIQHGADIHFKNSKGDSACSVADQLRVSESSPWSDYVNSLCYSS